MSLAVAIYTRLSADATGGEQTSTARQERACRAWAEAKGWDVATVFTDVESAYSGRERPGYEALLSALGEGIDVVLVWKLDRLARDNADFERFWSICSEAGTVIASVTEPIDTSDALGVAMVRVLITFANFESATKSVRLRSASRERAARGEPHQGFSGFGYDNDYNIVEAEAALIRQAATEVLAGRSNASVAREWTAMGLRGNRGALWTGGTVQNVLLSDRVAGQRRSRDDVVGGTWEPILDADTAAALRELHRLRLEQRGPDHIYLLSGLARCGRCGAKLSGTGNVHGGRNYICRPEPYGCSRVRVTADRAEAVVERAFLERRAEYVLAAHGPSSAAAARVRLRQLEHDFYVRGMLTKPDFDAMKSALLKRSVAVEDPEADRVAWEATTRLERKLALFGEIRQVIVNPSTTGRSWSPDRIQIAWWDDEPKFVCNVVPDPFFGAQSPSPRRLAAARRLGPVPNLSGVPDETSVLEIARQFLVPPSTVRAWLGDGGVGSGVHRYPRRRNGPAGSIRPSHDRCGFVP